MFRVSDDRFKLRTLLYTLYYTHLHIYMMLMQCFSKRLYSVTLRVLHFPASFAIVSSIFSDTQPQQWQGVGSHSGADRAIYTLSKTIAMPDCRHRISSRAEDTRASRKGPLDGAGDPPSFSARVVDPTHSSRDVPVNLTLQLTRRESLSVIKGGTCRCCQTVPNVWLSEPI